MEPEASSRLYSQSYLVWKWLARTISEGFDQFWEKRKCKYQ